MCICCCNRPREENDNIKIDIESSTENEKQIFNNNNCKWKSWASPENEKHLKNIFFFDNITKEKNTISYRDSNISHEVTFIDFSMIHYYSSNKNKYNYVISLCSKKEEYIKIIETFCKTKFILKKVCSDVEIYEQCLDIIEEKDFKLVNHFRKEINDILKIKSDSKKISQSIIIVSSSNSISNSNSSNDYHLLKDDLENKKIDNQNSLLPKDRDNIKEQRLTIS